MLITISLKLKLIAYFEVKNEHPLKNGQKSITESFKTLVRAEQWCNLIKDQPGFLRVEYDESTIKVLHHENL